MLRKALLCTSRARPDQRARARPRRARRRTGPTRRRTARSSRAPAARCPKARSLVLGAEPQARRATRASSARPTRSRCSTRRSRGARKHGYDIRPTDHRTLQRQAGAGSCCAINTQALQALPLPRDPARGHRLAQQRPRRGHARPLHRADRRARKPTQRPGLRRSTRSHNDTRRAGRASPTPTRSHCPNDQNLIAVIGRARRHRPGPRPAAARTATASRTSARASAATCRSRARASAPTTSSSTPATRRPATAARSAPARRTSASAPTAPTASCCATSPSATPASTTSTSSSPTATCFDRFKTFYAGEYGVLTFVEDHGLMQNCEAAGSGDSGLYPGAGAETGAGRDPKYYPTFRYSQEIRYCDSPPQRWRLLGHGRQRRPTSHHNNFYDNALGFTTDVFTAPGHPGFPQDSDLIEHNNFYANNFNPYDAELRRQADDPGAGRHRPVDRRRQRQRRPQQPLLRQLAPRHDAVRRARRDGLRPGDRQRPGPRLRPGQGLDVVRQPVLRQHDGRRARRQAAAQRHGLLVGQLPGQHRQLLVRATRRAPGTSITTSPRAAARLQRRQGPELEHRHRRPPPTRASWPAAWSRSRPAGLQPATSARGSRRRRSPAAPGAKQQEAASGGSPAPGVPGLLRAQPDGRDVRALRQAAGWAVRRR